MDDEPRRLTAEEIAEIERDHEDVDIEREQYEYIDGAQGEVAHEDRAALLAHIRALDMEHDVGVALDAYRADKTGGRDG